MNIENVVWLLACENPVTLLDTPSIVSTSEHFSRDVLLWPIGGRVLFHTVWCPILLMFLNTNFLFLLCVSVLFTMHDIVLYLVLYCILVMHGKTTPRRL